MEQPTVSLLVAKYTGRSRAIITAAYFGSFFSIGVCLASLGPVLPALARRSGTTLEVMGYLFVARSVGNVAGSLLGGVVFDRASRPHVPLLIGNLLCAVGCLVLPLLQTVSMLGCAVVTQGLCMGLLDTGGNVLLIWLHGTGRVEPYMQAMHFCFALGAVLAPLIIEAITSMAGDPDQFDGAFYAMGAVISFVSLPLIATRGPHPPRSGSEGGASDAATTTATATASATTTATAADVELTPLATIEAWLIAASGACLFFYVGAEVACGGFVFAFTHEYLHMDGALAHGLNSAYWGGLAIGRLAAIPLATRLRPATMLMLDFGGTLLASAALLPLAPSSGRSLEALAWVAFGALGASHASIYPSVLTHAERCMRVSGRVASVFVVSGALGEAALPFLVAVAYPLDPANFPRIVLAAGGLQLAAFVLAWMAGAELGRRQRPERDRSAPESRRVAVDAVEMTHQQGI